MQDQKIIETEKLREIEAKAAKATEGPWAYYGDLEGVPPKTIYAVREDDHSTHSYQIAEINFCGTSEDADYIASVSPDVIVPIIDELLELRALNESDALTASYFAGKTDEGRDTLPKIEKLEKTIEFLKERMGEMCEQMPCDDCPFANDEDGCEVKLAGGMDAWIEAGVRDGNK